MQLDHHSFRAMHSQLDAVVWTSNHTTSCATVLAQLEEDVCAIENCLNRFDPGSELYQLNKSTEEWVHLSPTLFGALTQGFDLHERTLGLFNPAYKSGAPLTDCFLLDAENNRVKKLIPEAELDFGALGKGIALQHIGEILLSNNILNAFVSFGGSSILTRGKHPHGLHWPFQLTNLALQQPLQLNDTSISVSGLHTSKGAEQHIYHPTTRQLNHQHNHVLVQMASPVEAEAVSTALMIATPEQQTQIISRFSIEHTSIL